MICWIVVTGNMLGTEARGYAYVVKNNGSVRRYMIVANVGRVEVQLMVLSLAVREEIQASYVQVIFQSSILAAILNRETICQDLELRAYLPELKIWQSSHHYVRFYQAPIFNEPTTISLFTQLWKGLVAVRNEFEGHYQEHRAARIEEFGVAFIPRKVIDDFNIDVN